MCCLFTVWSERSQVLPSTQHWTGTMASIGSLLAFVNIFLFSLASSSSVLTSGSHSCTQVCFLKRRERKGRFNTCSLCASLSDAWAQHRAADAMPSQCQADSEADVVWETSLSSCSFPVGSVWVSPGYPKRVPQTGVDQRYFPHVRETRSLPIGPSLLSMAFSLTVSPYGLSSCSSFWIQTFRQGGLGPH